MCRAGCDLASISIEPGGSRLRVKPGDTLELEGVEVRILGPITPDPAPFSQAGFLDSSDQETGPPDAPGTSGHSPSEDHDLEAATSSDPEDTVTASRNEPGEPATDLDLDKVKLLAQISRAEGCLLPAKARIMQCTSSVDAHSIANAAFGQPKKQGKEIEKVIKMRRLAERKRQRGKARAEAKKERRRRAAELKGPQPHREPRAPAQTDGPARPRTSVKRKRGRSKSEIPCTFLRLPAGCPYGSDCEYLHTGISVEKMLKKARAQSARGQPTGGLDINKRSARAAKVETRLVGAVKMWHQVKPCGFIIYKSKGQTTEYFAHRGYIMGGEQLDPGRSVSFEIGLDSKGKQMAVSIAGGSRAKRYLPPHMSGGAEWHKSRAHVKQCATSGVRGGNPNAKNYLRGAPASARANQESSLRGGGRVLGRPRAANSSESAQGYVTGRVTWPSAGPKCRSRPEKCEEG